MATAAERASTWATLALLGPMFSQRLDTLGPFKVPVVFLSGRFLEALIKEVLPLTGTRKP